MFYRNIKKVKRPSKLNVLVNKNNKLDKDYIPKDLVKINSNYSIKEVYLRKKAVKYFEKMCVYLKKQGLTIKAASAYRAFDYQKKIYDEYLKEFGKDYTDKVSARAGHSEHQTGLAVDIEGSFGTYDDFEKTKEFIWMRENAYKYGFILRYPNGKESITGYKYEPWHYRYIGKRRAKKIYKKGITLEEYLKRR